MPGLGTLTLGDTLFIGRVLEGFFYGIYSAIFVMYIQCQASRKGINETKNILIYPICALFTLSTITLVMDITRFNDIENKTPPHIYVSATINGLCDFISQVILIYRCWVTWSCNTRVIIIPSVLALTFLATWLASNGASYVTPDGLFVTDWGRILNLTAFITSLIVNAVVTGLITLRILIVFWDVRSTLEDTTLSVGGRKLRSAIFLMIESGMAMFTIQLIRVVVVILNLQNAVNIVIGTNQMFNGITPTIILVRVSMGLSYHDEQSMVETAASWRFASNPIEIVDQPEERRDDIGVGRSDDIQIVNR